jgi:hypothetical protein
MEGVVGNSLGVHLGANLGQHGVSPQVDEHVYQLELQAYWITFLDFKYKPLNFVFVEIRTIVG